MRDMQHLLGGPRQRAAMSASQRSHRDGEDDPLRSYAGELTNFTGATPPYEKPSDADLCHEAVDSDPADNAGRIVDALKRG